MADVCKSIIYQLYDRSTHFLLEFLQNLDDAAYEGSVTPTVKFTYTPGRLCIDSNQIGFSPEDIDAICAIGSSTKGEAQQSVRRIGEKGIGFKSVFRVATKVWLSSKDYSIRWNRGARFGAIAPEWASFPEDLEDGQTSFLCELNQDKQEEQIVMDLESFEVSLILFLNKIRRWKSKYIASIANLGPTPVSEKTSRNSIIANQFSGAGVKVGLISKARSVRPMFQVIPEDPRVRRLSSCWRSLCPCN